MKYFQPINSNNQLVANINCFHNWKIVTSSLQVAPASPSLVVRRAERELVLGLQVSFCRFFFSFVCLFVLLPEFYLFVFNLIFVLSGDKGDPRTRVW